MDGIKPKTIGCRIRQARRDKCMSQKELARKIGASVAHLDEIENGLIVLELETLIRLCRVLGVFPNYLLGRKAPSSEPPGGAKMGKILPFH